MACPFFVVIFTRHLWWRNREIPSIRGAFLKYFLHFLSREKKTKQKKTPVSRFFLRVANTVGARGNSPAVGKLRQSTRFFPPASSMLGAGQRGTSKPKAQHTLL
jgi:hypothetical protein